MRLNTNRRRAGTVAVDFVICTAVTVGLAALGYGIAHTALRLYLAFIETAVGSPLM